MKQYAYFVAGCLVVIGLLGCIWYVTTGNVAQAPSSTATSTLATSTLGGELILAANVKDADPATVSLGGVTVYATATGTVHSAYLFTNATVEGKDLGIADNLFLEVGNGKEQAGGHFDSPALNLADANLFKLGQASSTAVNLLDIINSGRNLRFDLFISSARGNRELQSAVLVYTCDSACEITLK